MRKNMLEQGQGEAVGSMQERDYPAIWNQTEQTNVAYSDYNIRQTLSGMARRQEPKSPLHSLWREVMRQM